MSSVPRMTPVSSSKRVVVSAAPPIKSEIVQAKPQPPKSRIVAQVPPTHQQQVAPAPPVLPRSSPPVQQPTPPLQVQPVLNPVQHQEDAELIGLHVVIFAPSFQKCRTFYGTMTRLISGHIHMRRGIEFLAQRGARTTCFAGHTETRSRPNVDISKFKH